jgi:amino acid transporter
MARDGIFPFSKYLCWIFKTTKIPLASVVFVFVIDSLLLLLQFVSTTAFNAIIAIAALGFQISYFMPILFRCTTARHTFRLGEFNLGKFSIPNAIISCVWLFMTSIFMFFPVDYPVTKTNMNYTIVIISGVALIALFYWIVSAGRWFVGPKRVDIDPVSSPTSEYDTAEDTKTTPVPEVLVMTVSSV